MIATLTAIFEGTIYFSIGIVILSIAIMCLYLMIAFCIADWHKKRLNKWHGLTDKEREQYIKYKLEKFKIKYKTNSTDYNYRIPFYYKEIVNIDNVNTDKQNETHEKH